MAGSAGAEARCRAETGASSGLLGRRPGGASAHEGWRGPALGAAACASPQASVSYTHLRAHETSAHL
eukprot:6860820-Alexandrium_andersonii.AAC.1